MAGKGKPVLHYFKGRGLGEMTRLTCAAAGIEFDEVTISKRDQLLRLIDDGKLLFQQLPLFEIDGQLLVGSDSIVRYLGRRADLYGKTNDEKYKIDLLMMGAKDFFLSDVGDYLFSSTPEKAIAERALPAANKKYLPAFEKTLTANGTGFLVGSSLTIADILLFDVLTHITDSPLPKLVEVLDDFPKCKDFVALIGSQPGIKDYLSSSGRQPVPTEEYTSCVREVLAWH